MNLVSVLAALVVVVAECSSAGILHVYTPGGQALRKQIVIANDYGFASHLMSVFSYDNGTLKKFKSRKHLTVNEAGEFVLDGGPDHNFSLQKLRDSATWSRLFYEGTDVFYLCGDGSVNYLRNCEGAREIAIVHERLD